ncbi:MAG TPA: NAD(P)/FAD-dependent oxidoreductase [Solirubrobacteraceae bacterium]|nr:NAD(P)/FAD-dependent oxidoreductase [Solirubrobacteraceae bacterium]
MSNSRDFDAVIVGASLAGSAAAIMLGRAGARVALLEQRPDEKAYKRICSHYIQSSAMSTLERLGLVEPMMQAGALRSRPRIHVPWGWIEPARKSTVPAGINLRRELLDPLIRSAAAETPGVELMLGQTVHELVHEDGSVCGVRARDTSGTELTLRSRLVVGADGRGSRVAKLAGVRERRHRHERFAYGTYYEGPPPDGSPDASLWLLDPDMAAAFPTDNGLTFYAVMPVKSRLERFRKAPAEALAEYVAGIPDAPPIRESEPVGPPEGKIDMTNVAHDPTAPGLALVGDAALAIDPLWGVGCGWALQSAQWLADGVSDALAEPDSQRGDSALESGLKRYRRKHARALSGHARMIYDYAGGRNLQPPERLLFSAATYDPGVARVMEAYGSRNIGPARMMASAMPRALAAHLRHGLGGRAHGASSSAVPLAGQ